MIIIDFQKSAAKDADAIATILEEQGNFNVKRIPSYKDENNRMRVHPTPGSKKAITLRRLTDEIKNFFNPQGEQIPEVALLFFAGHGLSYEEFGEYHNFLAPVNCDPEQEIWGYHLDNLQKLLRISRIPEKIVWLDACHSGALIRDFDSQSGTKWCLISAAPDHDVAGESQEQGVLTTVLLKALDYHEHDTTFIDSHALVKNLEEIRQADGITQQFTYKNSEQSILLTGQHLAVKDESLQGVCPYKGLLYFDYQGHDPLFYKGRAALTAQLLDQVKKQRLVAVLGASGSGKSSLVRAGLIHQLQTGHNISGHWQILPIMRPGATPLAELTAIVAKVDENYSEHLLIVDQFEEVFTLCQDAKLREAFFEKLLALTDLYLVIVMRADFFAHCIAKPYAGLADKIKTNLFTITPMTTEELQQAIAFYANEQRIKAESQKTLAVTGQLGIQAVLAAQIPNPSSGYFDRALLLAIQAVQKINNTETQGNLLHVLQSNPQIEVYLRDHSSSVMSVAFSPDGKKLASASRDKTVIIWDVENKKAIGQPLQKHSDSVLSVAFSPEGELLASASDDNTVILWNAEKQIPIGQPLKKHTSSVWSVIFDPSGKRLASAGDDKTIIVWDVKQQTPIGQPLQSHTNNVNSITFSPDGKQLASASHDGTVILWNVENQTPIGQALRGHNSDVNGVAFSPDGELFASASDDYTVILWNVKKQIPIGNPLQGHNSWVRSVAFNPVNSKQLASASYDKTVILWDTENQSSIGKPLQGHSGYVLSLAFDINGKRLVSASSDKSIILWNLNKKTPIGQFLETHNSINSVVFSPDNKHLAGMGPDGIIIWDIETKKIKIIKLSLQEGEHLGDHLISITFIDDKHFVSVSTNGRFNMWNVESQTPIRRQSLQRYSSWVNVGTFCLDGKIFAGASPNNTIIIWNLETNTIIKQPLQGHGNRIMSLAFDPEGKQLAIATGKTIIVWDVSSQMPIGKPLLGHSSWVTKVVFSSNSKYIASASTDRTVIIWDIDAQVPIGKPLKGHKDSIWDIAFSVDGKQLASASSDETVIIWDVSNQTPIGKPLQGHNGWVKSVEFSPDGKQLASVDNNGTVILWDIEPQSWLKIACYKVGRNFTQEEWKHYLPDESYQKTGSQYPAGE